LHAFVGFRRFDAHTIKQSCSWACSPENVITVSLHHATVDILSACSPKVTISGLGDAVVEDGDIELTDLLNNKNTSGIWEKGTLSVELGHLMPSHSRAQDFHFTFKVKNPNYPVTTPPTISMMASIDPIERCLYDKTGQTFAGVMTTPSVCADQWDFAGGSEFETATTTSINNLNADSSAGKLEVMTTKTRAKDANQLNGTCLGCCHKEVCTTTTVGKFRLTHSTGAWYFFASISSVVSMLR